MLSRVEHPRAHIDVVDGSGGLVGVSIASDEAISVALCQIWETASDALCASVQPDLGAAWLAAGQGPLLRETDVRSREVRKLFSVMYVDPLRHPFTKDPLLSVGATVVLLGVVAKIAFAPLCSREDHRHADRLRAVEAAFAE